MLETDDVSDCSPLPYANDAGVTKGVEVVQGCKLGSVHPLRQDTLVMPCQNQGITRPSGAW